MFGFSRSKSVRIDRAEIEELHEGFKSVNQALQDALNMKILYSPGANATSHDARGSAIAASRYAYRNSPLGYLPVALTTWFALGVGGLGIVDVLSKDEDTSGNRKSLDAQTRFLREYWNEPINQAIFTGYTAQEQLACKLQTDGDLFVLTNSNTAQTRFSSRVVDVSEILQIVTNPDDPAVETYYKRSFTPSASGFGNTGVGAVKGYHPSVWVILDEYRPKEQPNEAELLAGSIYHLTFGSDPTDHWGWPALARAVDWIEFHKGMAGDLRTLIRALSTFITDTTVKPGRKADILGIASMADKLIGQLARRPTIGAEKLHGPQVETKPIDVKTGAASMTSEGMKDMVLMVSAATGIPYHYMGDPSTGNLATAKSMELPIIKKVRAFQSNLRTLYEGVLNFILQSKWGEQAGRVVTKYPPILERDMTEFMGGLQTAYQNGWVDDDRASELAKETLETRV